MKQRFSSLDVKVISRELASELVNLRVSNIYDLSSRIFLFKLAKPDHRKQLIVDSGFRCHITQYSRATATEPSTFVKRLRKFLRSRRVTSVTQVGTDRIIDFSFSDGMYHLLLEFFAGGNVILTDREYNIIALLRIVPAEGEQEEVKVGLKYTLTNKQNYAGVPPITAERLKGTIERAKELFAAQEDSVPKKSKKKKKDAEVLRKALSHGFPEFPPLLLGHAFAVRGLDPATPLDEVLQDDGLLDKVMGVLREAESVTESLVADDRHPGYIVAKEDTRASSAAVESTSDATSEKATDTKKPGLLYEDYHPFKPRQFEGQPGTTILEFDQFNTTVDEYYSSIESQKLESKLVEREEAAKRKLESVKQEHEKRIGALKEVQEIHIRKAEAIRSNVFRVQEAMDAVNGLIAQGMDWVEIARLIEMEQSRGNPVAKIIKLPLKLYENTITLLLGEASEEHEDEEDENDLFSSDSDREEDDEEDDVENAASVARERAQNARQTSQTLTVDIDLGLSPWANATQYYEQKKVAAVKEQRTIQSSTKALKSHEKKVTDDLKRALKQEKQVLRPARQPFWFEKFLFFISSEGYLVLGGRDALQSELLYRRYLKKGDVFVHADISGATPMIVKNRPGSPDAPIPPSTLSQAGNLCVATSTAWDSKAVMAAWWVRAEQVTKTAVAGDLLPTGEFSVIAEKNYLAPSQLVLGFAVMFQISKDSVKNHKSAHFEEPAIAEAATAEEVRESSVGGEGVAQISDLRSDENIVESVNAEGNESNDTSSESDDETEDAGGPPRENPLQGSGAGAPEREPSHRRNDKREHNHVNGDADVEGEGDGQDAPEPDQTTERSTLPGEDVGESQHGDESRLVPPAQHVSRPDRPTSESSAPTRKGSVSPAKSGSGPLRGKKAKKNKKAAARYADQDEEERALALRLLGADNAKAQKAAAATAAKANQEKEREAAKQRRKAQHERAAEAERKRQALFAEGAAGDDYDEETAAAEAADLTWIPALIGTPLPEDELLAAIPVCAPWAALGRYKYKAKLQPGAVKKGKAVKEIVGRWVAETTSGKVRKDHAEDAGIDRAAAEKLRAKEAELIKAWREAEVINTVPVGKVRVMTGGGSGGGGDSKGKGKTPAKGVKGKKK